ncbi:ankyrin repeats (3 copies) domain-containing protein [Trichoderma breve]|uniref:Ankyrin repeats (3 copies) domain-containing protein n=1 Tax=Trichoderma breve TaxID=2034170 RepID=A0A9W9B5X9_9HYPO|nr:ankyrin repeats (3 copies) domain-containing protein [Trichoderma breve]KAJ4854325.1 ankyrin repeats (3 copies) domain-containing protein [Trichoderma breve]
MKDSAYEDAERLQKEKEAHPTTCNWLFNTEQFQQWCRRTELSSHNGVLWIKGNPGTGKSTLMKHTLQYCEEKIFENSIIAAHFFNARGDSFEQTPIGMLRLLVYQLILKESSTYERFIPLFRDKQQKHTEWAWREPELQNFLLSETQYCPKPLVLFVDALDECSESHVRNLVRFLEDLSVKSKVILNICLSSRHYPTISMEKHLELVVETTSEHDKDIIKYTGDKLTKIDEQIKREVLKKASGVFMWVVLVIEMLNRAYDEGQLEAMHQLLQEVPSDLDEVFLTLLSKDNRRKQETLFMLQFVLFTRRLLSPKELYCATLAEMEVYVGPWDPAQITPDDIRRRITHSSRGLIEVRQGGTVQFIHESVKDFLVRNKRLRILDQNLGLVKILLEKRIDVDAHEGLFGTALQTAAAGGGGEVVKTLLQKGAKINAQGGFFNTALQAAASEGHSEVVSILLEAKGANIDAQGGIYGTALQAAAAEGNYDAVAMLLEEEAHIDAQGGIFNTALQAAASGGHKKIVTMLLKKGANINAQGGFYGTALQAAAAKGEKDIVEVLLEGGANIKIQAGAYGTALRAAVSEGHKVIAAMLLKEGERVHEQEDISSTAPDATVVGSEKAITDIRVADVNTQRGASGTSSQAAILTGKDDVEVLLQEVGKWDVKSDYFSTALQKAIITNDDKEIIAVLLKEGVSTNTRSIAFKALFNGISKPRKDVMGVLLEGKMSANRQWIFDTALCIAASKGKKYFVAKLREKGAKFDTRDIFFSYTLLADPREDIHDDAFRIFLENGADINTQNYRVETDVETDVQKAESQRHWVDIWLCLAGLISGILYIFMS